ncbi:MAG: hypothetical protein AAGN35_12950 [Bacteroidota bacterium]
MKTNLYLLVLLFCLPTFLPAQIDSCPDDWWWEDDDDVTYIRRVKFKYEKRLDAPAEFPRLLFIPNLYGGGRPLNGGELGRAFHFIYTSPKIGRLNVQIDQPFRGRFDYHHTQAQWSRAKNQVRRFFIFDAGFEIFFRQHKRLYYLDFTYDTVRDWDHTSVDRVGKLPLVRQFSHALRLGTLHYQGSLHADFAPHRQLIADDGTLLYDGGNRAESPCCRSLHTNFYTSAVYFGLSSARTKNATVEILNLNRGYLHKRVRRVFYADAIFAPLVQLDPVLVAPGRTFVTPDEPLAAGEYAIDSAFHAHRWGFRVGANWISLLRKRNIGYYYGMEVGMRPGIRAFRREHWLPRLYANLRFGLVLGAMGRTIR